MIRIAVISFFVSALAMQMLKTSPMMPCAILIEVRLR